MQRLLVLSILVAAVAFIAVSCEHGGPEPTHPGGAATSSSRPQSEEWLDPNASKDLTEPPPAEWDDHSELITAPDVVALVGDTTISRDEFFAELERTHKTQALEMLIDDAIIGLESERVGMELSPVEVRAYAEELEDRRIEALTDEVNQRFRGQKTLEEYLRETRGVGVDGFKAENVEKAMETGIAEKQRRIEMLVSFERLTSARVSISHIQVNTGNKAAEIIKRLKAGANFSKIAGDESEDGHSRTRGGSLDPFLKGDVVFRRDLQGLGRDFLEALFGAKVGLMPEPLKSERDAWHVVMVLENQPALDKSFAQMRGAIEKDVEDGIFEMEGRYWRMRKRHQYKIDEKKEGDVLVTVGPAKITVAELHKRLNSLFGRDAVQGMITARIVKLESARIGLKNTKEDIRKMAEQITEDRLQRTRRMLMYQYPMQFGRTFTLDDYIRQEMGKSLAEFTSESVETLMESGRAEEELTLAELVSHYLLTTERVTVQQAVFDSEYAAREAWHKLRQGADFSKLAQKNNPPPLAESKGILPSFSREEYDHRPVLLFCGKNIVRVAFATAPGRFSGVFRCKDGWRIIKVLNRQKAADLTYATLKGRIRETVFESREWMNYVFLWTRIKARSTKVAIKLPS